MTLIPPVHLISDTSELRTFPVNVVKLIEVFSFLKHPNMGIGVQVSSNGYNKVPDTGNHPCIYSLSFPDCGYHAMRQ